MEADHDKGEAILVDQEDGFLEGGGVVLEEKRWDLQTKGTIIATKRRIKWFEQTSICNTLQQKRTFVKAYKAITHGSSGYVIFVNSRYRMV